MMHCRCCITVLIEQTFCARAITILAQDGSSTQLIPIVFQETVTAAQADLIRQQEELEMKAAELDRKELELQNRAGGRGVPPYGETHQH